jgi:endonuclease/exonuclease/phosphatase family metal-dependent hydrolase
VNNYFVCEITGETEQSLTETEIIHGVEPEWVDIERAFAVFGSFENVGDEELAAQYKREFTVLNKFMNKKIKVMTFNIQHCLDYLNNKIDIDLFVDSIEKINPDICGLNEVRGRGVRDDYTAQAETLGSALQMHSVFGCSAMIGGENAYGNAVLSKMPVREMKVIPIKETVTGAEPRSVLFADCGDIVVLQTHLGLKEPEFFEGIDTVYTLLKSQSKPCVLMGDFNMRPDHPALSRLFDDPDINHADTGFTFPSDAPDRKIDYIFTNNKVKISSCYVPELIVSDHRPIIAEIEF